MLLLATPLQGSYGTVRACTHVPSGKQYAVKILSKRKGNEERSEIIMREVRSSSKRSMQHLVKAAVGQRVKAHAYGGWVEHRLGFRL